MEESKMKSSENSPDKIITNEIQNQLKNLSTTSNSCFKQAGSARKAISQKRPLIK